MFCSYHCPSNVQKSSGVKSEILKYKHQNIVQSEQYSALAAVAVLGDCIHSSYSAIIVHLRQKVCKLLVVVATFK